MALILVGGLTMVVRKKALVQVIGLIVVENGVYTARWPPRMVCPWWWNWASPSTC